jgi:hypothetical protein
MDCIDCHNVVAHRVAQTPEQAVDRAIATGRIPRALPFVRREGVRLMKASHGTEDDAERAIGTGLQQFYASAGSGIDAAAVAGCRDVAAAHLPAQRLPVMKVTFGTYPDNVGHTTSSGCFRCHDGSHTAKDGTAISAECEYCHKQLRAAPPRAAFGFDEAGPWSLVLGSWSSWSLVLGPSLDHSTKNSMERRCARRSAGLCP